MPTYECSECGGSAVERSYDVPFVEVTCPECGEFCPHVNMDHPRVRQYAEAAELDEEERPATASALVDALRDG